MLAPKNSAAKGSPSGGRLCAEDSCLPSPGNILSVTCVAVTAATVLITATAAVVLAATVSYSLSAADDFAESYSTSNVVAAMNKVNDFVKIPVDAYAQMRAALLYGRLPDLVAANSSDQALRRALFADWHNVFQPMLFAAEFQLLYVGAGFEEGSWVDCFISSSEAPAFPHVCSFSHHSNTTFKALTGKDVFYEEASYANWVATGVTNPDTDYDPRTREWYTAAPKVMGSNPIFSSVYVDFNFGQPVVDVTGPLHFGAVQTFIGVSSITLDLRQIASFLANLPRTANSLTALIDGEGFMLAASDMRPIATSVVLGSNYTVPPEALERGCGVNVGLNYIATLDCRLTPMTYGNSDLRSLYERDAGFFASPNLGVTSKDTSGTYQPYFTETVERKLSDGIGASSYMTSRAVITAKTEVLQAEIDWLLVAIMPVSDVTEDIIEGMNIGIIVACIMVAVACVLCGCILFFLLRPLGQLSAMMGQASQLQDGTLGAAIADKSAMREIRTLQESFEQLSDQLRRAKSFLPATLLAQLEGLGTDDDDDEEEMMLRGFGFDSEGGADGVRSQHPNRRATAATAGTGTGTGSGVEFGDEEEGAEGDPSEGSIDWDGQKRSGRRHRHHPHHAFGGMLHRSNSRATTADSSTDHGGGPAGAGGPIGDAGSRVSSSAYNYSKSPSQQPASPLAAMGGGGGGGGGGRRGQARGGGLYDTSTRDSSDYSGATTNTAAPNHHHNHAPTKGISSTVSVANRTVTIAALNLRNFHRAVLSAPTLLDKGSYGALVDAFQLIAKGCKGLLDSFHGDRFFFAFNAVRPCGPHATMAATAMLRIVSFMETQTYFVAGGSSSKHQQRGGGAVGIPSSPSPAQIALDNNTNTNSNTTAQQQNNNSNINNTHTGKKSGGGGGGGGASPPPSAVPSIPSVTHFELPAAQQQQQQQQPIAVTCGIATGLCMVGNLGSDRSKRFTVIGPAYTYATVLERLCKRYPATSVLMANETALEVESTIGVMVMDVVPVPSYAAAAAAAPPLASPSPSPSSRLAVASPPERMMVVSAAKYVRGEERDYILHHVLNGGAADSNQNGGKGKDDAAMRRGKDDYALSAAALADAHPADLITFLGVQQHNTLANTVSNRAVNTNTSSGASPAGGGGGGADTSKGGAALIGISNGGPQGARSQSNNNTNNNGNGGGGAATTATDEWMYELMASSDKCLYHNGNMAFRAALAGNREAAKEYLRSFTAMSEEAAYLRERVAALLLEGGGCGGVGGGISLGGVSRGPSGGFPSSSLQPPQQQQHLMSRVIHGGGGGGITTPNITTNVITNNAVATTTTTPTTAIFLQSPSMSISPSGTRCVSPMPPPHTSHPNEL